VKRVVRYLKILSIALLPGFGSSQNLILNPSLEDFEQCPTRLGSFNTDVKEWSSPTQGSTDYFNGCSTSMGTPENFNGSQPADFGQGYAGLYMYAPDDYREYVQATLRQTLVKGETYELSFYISLAESSDFAVREFEVLFAEKQVSIPIKKVLSKMHLYKDKGNSYHFETISYPDFYRDTQDWIRVSTRFKANGTENFLVIGNFKDNNRTRKFNTSRDSKKGAYYYLDMIALQADTDGVAQHEPGRGRRRPGRLRTQSGCWRTACFPCLPTRRRPPNTLAAWEVGKRCWNCRAHGRT
jgi:hypothetical protein